VTQVVHTEGLLEAIRRALYVVIAGAAFGRDSLHSYEQTVRWGGRRRLRRREREARKHAFYGILVHRWMVVLQT
jgi:hypothetical protein